MTNSYCLPDGFEARFLLDYLIRDQKSTLSDISVLNCFFERAKSSYRPKLRRTYEGVALS